MLEGKELQLNVPPIHQSTTTTTDWSPWLILSYQHSHCKFHQWQLSSQTKEWTHLKHIVIIIPINDNHVTIDVIHNSYTWFIDVYSTELQDMHPDGQAQCLQGGIVHRFLQAARVGRGHQDDAAEADGTRGLDFGRGADFVDNLRWLLTGTEGIRW